MILHHWRPRDRPVTNFGDELNVTLWPLVLGHEVFDRDTRTDAATCHDDVMFLGIGSLLGWPKSDEDGRRRRVVFGTGATSDDAARDEPLTDSWDIYCVRGPSTAQAYGLDQRLAITDPALLVANHFERVDPVAAVGYMPHLEAAEAWGPLFRDACSELGYVYIDPRDEVVSVIAAIGSVSLLVSEAMHGAIVADALRVPWVPVHTTTRPHRFKWTDWCRAMELNYEPRRLPNGVDLCGRVGLRGGVVDFVAKTVVIRRLAHLAATDGCLSSRQVHDDRLDRLTAAAERLRGDIHEGRFSVGSADR